MRGCVWCVCLSMVRGVAMESMSQAKSPESSKDLGDPLDEALEAKRAETSNKAYDGFCFETDSIPLARIIGRIYREHTSPKRNISTIPLKKMRTEGGAAGLVPKHHVAADLG